MVRIDVSARVLQWARERSGERVDDLTRTFPRLPQWESGEAAPTLRQLETFARRTRTPLGYFFLAEPPVEELPIPSYRTMRDNVPAHPSPDLLDTVYDMLRKQGWMREHRLNHGWDPLGLVGSARLDADTDDVAALLRAALGLEEGWASRLPSWQQALAVLRSSAEQIGVLVMVSGIVGNNTRRSLDPEEFRGFVLTDEFAPLVFINGVDAKAAQIFSLAHELAHLCFNLSAVFDLRGLMPSPDASERACNAVAAEFLVPRLELVLALDEFRSAPDPIRAIARRFKVSRIVAARRLLDLNHITRQQFFEFYEAYVEEDRAQRRDQGSGGDFIINLDYKIGRPFATAVIGAAREGALLYSEAYELVGVRGETFEKFATRLGWGR